MHKKIVAQFFFATAWQNKIEIKSDRRKLERDILIVQRKNASTSSSKVTKHTRRQQTAQQKKTAEFVQIFFPNKTSRPSRGKKLYRTKICTLKLFFLPFPLLWLAAVFYDRVKPFWSRKSPPLIIQLNKHFFRALQLTIFCARFWRRNRCYEWRENT